MRNRRPTIRAATLAGALLGLCVAPADAQISLHSTGGGTINALTTMTVSAAPGTQYLLILSLSSGPTALPAPHAPSSLDVGFDLLDLSVGLPGFLGTVPVGGSIDVPLFFPPLPILDVLTLHFQAVRIVGGLIDGKSQRWVLTPAMPFDSEPTLTSMSVRRAGYAAITRSDGKVLLLGGGDDGIVASYGQTAVDLYDPATQTFTPMPPMLAPRVSHTATALNDGRILLTGGADAFPIGEPVATAEIYHPFTGVSVPVGNLAVARGLHQANMLPDGRVLVSGGTSSFMNAFDIITKAHKTTEIFNPATNTFSAGPNMAEPRVGHTATALQNGKILCAGGFSYTTLFSLPYISDKGQLYTPNAGAGTFGSQKSMSIDRAGHAAVLLQDGRVAIIGGATSTGASILAPIEDNTIELFDETIGSGTFAFDSFLSVARGLGAAVVLQSGNVVIAGGAYGSLYVPTPDSTIDVYHPNFGLLATFPMTHARANATAVALSDGTVLVAGGGEEPNPQAPTQVISFDSAEIFHP
ncbi:MAG: hypothetical protein IPH13_13180 [Planctomycetes bacterium]|nr:hypothetical protein [Planctomycetota bacterium]MCC7172893.1 hypothetical protein [Planctomycetota bacterium]